MHQDLDTLNIASEAAAREGHVEVVGLWGSSKTLLAAQVAEALGASLLYVAPGRQEAEAAYEDFRAYTDPSNCALLPAWEVLPTDAMAPSDDIVAERMNTLNALALAKAEGRPVFAAAPLRAFLQRVVNRAHLLDGSVTLRVGEEHDLEDLALRLVKLGYERELMVEERGHMSVRGGIFDVFPISAELPYRIEFFGDEIESIRVFEPETQRSMESVDTAHILPRSEKELVFEESEGDAALSLVTDYLPERYVLVVDEPLTVREQAERLEAQFPDTPYMVDWDTAESVSNPAMRLDLAQVAFTESEEALRLNAKTRAVSGWAGRLEEFWSQLEEWELAGYAMRVFCANDGEQRRLEALFEKHGHRPGEGAFDMTLHQGRLRGGFVSDADKLAVISEREIFGRKYVRRVRRRFQAGTALTTFSDLTPGDFLVHETHGIGRYHGMRRFEGRSGDFLTIQYAKGDLVYLPVTHIDQVQKFVAGGGAVPKVDKIGGKSWAKTRKNIKESVRIMAERLLKLYAQRESQPGYAFGKDTPFQAAFEEEFPYEETADQLRAIADVKRDMESDRPMDRLLCGDVGFGKTEVAMRAAFKAVMDHKQVAMLVPTTVLAEQHFITFSERFAGFPVKIEMMSRFKTPKENRETVMRARSGEVDIVIGTHRLASKDVGFQNLGLAIIDEEQRFGVKHKERLKELRANVDVLTLTATPIPRTLHLSMSGVRDMSVISTAPNDRLPIHTHIAAFDEQLVAEAIQREVGRQGQVFYLHNRVGTIEKVAETIRTLVPEARVGVAHGQMPERELETMMTSFIARDFDVLACTTIIGSGLDIPNANTIIVDRADMFGLAELYQIRGRVGRYKHRAFAYLLVPGDRALTEEAQQRLGALEEFSVLGSGFRIAMRDLEIRGAGNFLGGEQSGHINTVGFETYRELVEEAVAELKGQPVKRHTLPPFDVPADASIPDTYIPLESQKITLYRRIASLRDAEELDEMRSELTDRFGRPPKPVQRLLEIMAVRIAAADCAIRKLAASPKLLVAEFETGVVPDESARAALKEAYGIRLKLAKREGFSVEVQLEEENAVAVARDLVEKLRENARVSAAATVE